MSRVIPTGNEYLSLPVIRADDGAIESLNVILMQFDGLLEFCGPGDVPLISCPAMEAERGQWEWSYRADWLPEFRHRNHPDKSGVIFAPPGERFLVFRAPRVAPSTSLGAGRAPHFSIAFGGLHQTANLRHALPRADYVVSCFGWAQELSAMVNVYCGPLVASIAFRSPGRAGYKFVDARGARDLTQQGSPITTSGSFGIEVTCEGEPDLVVSVGLSSVETISANIEAGRVPVDEWLRRTEAHLSQRRVTIPGDPGLETKANRNGHFARYFAMGRTLDTDEAVSMTSRSHRYYVSSAYWDRDSLLWLYPFLLRHDKPLAEDLLRYAFGRQLAHAGIHSRYVSGRILEYGFELDELLAPLVALGNWARACPREAIWEEAPFQMGVAELLKRLAAWRCPDVALYRTELMPTDDRIVGGRDILTYDNALAAYALEGLVPVLERTAPAAAGAVRAEASAIRKAVMDNLVRDGMFVWAADAAGGTEFYDEAAGSLVLLPYYDFCAADSPVYRKTLARLYSKDYPYFRQGAFAELGNRHTDSPHPWVLSACNSILSRARLSEGLDFLRRAPMDDGIACESVNIQTGQPETGLHFATCAGFVAHAITSGTRTRITGHETRDL
ncbi:MAG: glycoside hydrolase family 125 protein [Kiritimatiellae bacterium]|nr:glycoside hydrolase family 125 protein [Kiritimatiellia bacterium]